MQIVYQFDLNTNSNQAENEHRLKREVKKNATNETKISSKR